MGVNTVDLLVGNPTRLPSRSVWGRIPWHDIKEGVVDGYARRWDFADLKLSTNVNAAQAYWADGLRLFGSDGAAVAALAVDGGGVTLGSDGDNEGVGLGQGVPVVQIARGKGRLAWELCLRTSTIADAKHGFVAGLADATALTATVPITAAGALADLNFVGFHRVEGDGDMVDTVYKADGVTAVTVKADAGALAADTLTKLGMVFEPVGDAAGDAALSFYLNGVRLPDAKLIPAAAGTDFPNDLRLGFVFALLNATASTPGTTSLLWAQLAQEF